MDLKGIHWVGHIYQKYETMLLEVEEDMYQDVVGYVESQVQTVGHSVKKFYADVIQDLILPSTADLLKDGDSDLSVDKYADICDCKKTKAGRQEVPKNVEAERVLGIPKAIDAEVENLASSFHGFSSVNSSSVSSAADSLSGSCSEFYAAQNADGSMQDYSSHDSKINTEKKNQSPFVMAGAITTMKGSSDRESGILRHVCESHEESCNGMATSVSVCDEIKDASHYESNVSFDGPSAEKSVLVRSIDNEVEVRVSCCSGFAESNDMSSSHVNVKSAMSGDGQCCDINVKEAVASNSGEEDNRDNGDEDEINSKNITEQELETIQQSDLHKLEETCVVVTGDELHFVPPRKGESRTYKKKICKVLSLRRKTARKEEYEQLAVWFSDDAGSDHQCAESVKPVLSIEDERNSPIHDICESEWELL